jgi:putative chitinase
MIWFDTLHKICPGGNLNILRGLASQMEWIVSKAELSSKLRLCHFLAQVCEESDGLHTTVEYGSGIHYEGRHDLGNTHHGDGTKYKGRGLIQLTGRTNYATYGYMLGQDLINHPELAAEFPAAAQTAALYWNIRHINPHADEDDIVRVTECVNGGTNGLAQRKRYLQLAKHVLS